MKRNLLSIDARMLFAGGIGTYIQNLLKRIRFETLGLQVDVYVRTQKEAQWMKEFQPNASVKICPYWIYGVKEQLFWLKNLKGGAFWAPHYNIPWGGYEKLIVTLHDAALPLTEHTPWFYHLYAGVMYGRIRQKANAILTVSEFSRHMNQERGRIFGIPMTVTLLGVDPTWFTAPSGPRPYSFKYLIYIGNLKPHKNLIRLLKAWEKLSENSQREKKYSTDLARPEPQSPDISDYKLVCVGPFKSLKSRDENAFRLMNRMKGNVIFSEEIVGEPLRDLVKHAEGLILPSTYEGFGLPPLEAMASSVPVLASWAEPMPEVCGPSALYCDPYSVEEIAAGIKRLVGLSGQERQMRIAAGVEHAAKFNWDKTAKETFEVFKTTLG